MTKYYRTNKHVVLLPGWGFHASIWQSSLDYFSDYSTQLIDLPLTYVEFNSHSLSEVARIIDNQIHQECRLITWSLSGLIVPYLFQLNPDKYKKFVTVTSSPKFTAHENWPGISANILHDFYFKTDNATQAALKKFNHLIAHQGIHSILKPHGISAQHKNALLFYLKILEQTDVRELYSQLSIPILHLFGGKDAILPPDIYTSMKDYYPHHDIDVIPEAGHMPFLTHQEKCFTLIKNFLYDE